MEDGGQPWAVWRAAEEGPAPTCGFRQSMLTVSSGPPTQLPAGKTCQLAPTLRKAPRREATEAESYTYTPHVHVAVVCITLICLQQSHQWLDHHLGVREGPGGRHLHSLQFVEELLGWRLRCRKELCRQRQGCTIHQLPANTPRCSFGAARRPSNTQGRCSGHRETASLALKAALSCQCVLATILLDCGW